ncbi:MAG: hypothetical protein OMM_01147 [Candidatus Magnetoglobus multicellularis str. Araruama]|uniref:Glycosyltransferase subfamily 4-like N-terminal domain-containing protein n=1 Tax=Candidatus Magnetoglobus multicellularis str. Araruama TaxID=890399 RepID=A0A1V1PEH1_9BACT|nr:MAG: hypothetical protein OMM_01147 [Candidatus Magnetoglobus multicellularis str. Araruama]
MIDNEHIILSSTFFHTRWRLWYTLIRNGTSPDKKNHRVTMICGSSEMAHTGLNGPFSNGRREGMVDGIHVVEFHLPYSNKDSFFKRSLTFFRFAMKSIVWAFNNPYDLLFATSTPLTAGIPGIAAKLFRQKPFVFEVRDLWPELPEKMGVIQNPWILLGMHILEWLSYHSANACIGLSPGIVNGICKKGIAKEFISMVPNGCDIQLIGPIKSFENTPKNNIMRFLPVPMGLQMGLMLFWMQQLN